jgi:thiol-disulfide isomerase/thioredoxin
MAQYKTYNTMSNEENNNQNPVTVEVLKISSIEQRKTLIQNNLVVVIDYYTDWCGPCKSCAPLFANLATKYTKKGHCAFAKENVEDRIGDYPEKIKGVPCFQFHVNGQFIRDLTVTGADIDTVEKNIQNLHNIKTYHQ